MNKSTAYVKACNVILACDAYRKARKARQERRIEGWVQKEMSKCFFPAKTREKALERLSEKVYWFGMEGSYWADQVEALRTLALVSEGHITITTADAALLNDYWPSGPGIALYGG